MPEISTTQTDKECPIRVVITPSQSSFFAGELFSVTITFTNTQTPEAGPSKPFEQPYTPTRTHKRGAHSISSAPLARPPTSPGIPRTSPSPRKLTGFRDDALPGRKGLIGTTKKAYQDGQLPELLERRRKKLLAKSLSISVSSDEMEEQIGEGLIAATPASAPFSQQAFPDTRQSPTSPHVPSPLSRTDTLSLSSNHPHARKQSILDGQFSLDVLSPTTSIPPQPHTPTTSLSLSTISESSHTVQPSTSSLPAPTTPRISSPLSPSYSQPAFNPAASNSNTVQAYPSIAASAATPAVAISRPHHNRRFSQQIQIGLGRPPNGLNQAQPPRTAFSSTFPKSNTELILYSYAQLVGTIQVIPEGVGGGTPTLEQLYRVNRIRRTLIRRRAVVGGGSMDISQSLHSGWGIGSGIGGGGFQYPNHQPMQGSGYPRRRPGHSRSTSFSASLMSLLSPAGGPTPPAMGERAITTSPSHMSANATSTLGHNGSGPGGGGLGLGILNSPPLSNGSLIEEDVDPELPLPTFEAQPSMLAVDLSLSPGESRSYTYTIKLPDVLPPTYKGRALRFSYELVVGTCRARSSTSASAKSTSSGAAGMNSISRVMKVPIRVYNHVTVDRPARPYDVLWPVSHNRLSGLGKGKEREIPETQGKVVEETGPAVSKLRKAAHLSPPRSSRDGSLDELKQYTKRLLASLPPVVNGNGIQAPGSRQSDDNKEILGASSSALGSPTVDRDTVKQNASLRTSLDETREQEEEEDRALGGCREAVEILTRLPKKASYDVNKDGVKVAVLTFTKSAYRLGETVSGIVELNDRVGRARVLQLCAILEAHESLPTSIAPVQSARNLKRAYAEHYASFTLNTLRTTFALDIPSDASPAFQVKINDFEDPSSSAQQPTSLGGLEWKVRLCLLVAIASDSSDFGTEGVYFKSLERDGPRGEWGSSWRAPKSLAPLEKPRSGLNHLKAEGETPKTKSWSQFFVDSMWSTIGGVTGGGGGGGGDTERESYDGDESDIEAGLGGEGKRNYDGIKPDFAGGVGKGVNFGGGEEGWKEVKLETVECEVPIKVWPGNTAFRAVDVVFDV